MMIGGYFLVILLILVTISSSLFITSEIMDYPSFVNVPNSWRNIPSSDFSFWESANVRPILVNGMFVCGFHCSSAGESCLLAISIFKASSDGNASFSPQVVWSANRNNPVEVGAILQLSGDGKLMLQDDKGALVWSPSTGGKPVSRLNLTAEGNLILFDKTNDMAWQSFDHPTDSLVVGQRLVTWQELRANVYASNSSVGLYAFAIIDGWFTAYIAADASQIYYRQFLSQNTIKYVKFQTGRFGSLPVVDSADFIQLGSDGHLKAYEWKESQWEGVDLFELDRCDYPLTCGNYGICLEEGCGCPEATNPSGTTYFRPINSRRPDLGCSPILPTSCDLAKNQSLLEIHDVDYVASNRNYSDHTNLNPEDCKQACLRNCSCKAAIVEYYYDLYECSLFSEVISLKMKDSNDLSYTWSYNISVFLKVQNFSTAQRQGYLNKNLSSPNLPRKKTGNMAVVLGSTFGSIFVVIIICTLRNLFIRKGFKEVEEECLDHISGIMPTRFSFKELKMATKDFSNKLGEGGFGCVFQGTLPNSGSQVAVKHLDGFGPIKKSFMAEVQTIGSIHHINLVSLVGFCAEKAQRFLIYEYMPNGSLDQWIFIQSKRLGLDWQIRKKIILGIAKGLAYLHEECYQKIIHLDIKPQNILLDEDFNAKVSDFGLSKLVGRDESQVITTMRGTPGYMAPEWLSSSITEKADVYSFGIVVLEILCGRRNVDGSQQEEGDRHLLGVFWRKQEEGQVENLVDKCSDDMQSNSAEVMRMMNVAAWCLQSEYARRPSMSIVVKVLEGLVDVEDINLDINFLNGLTPDVVETFASAVLPSMLSGPR